MKSGSLWRKRKDVMKFNDKETESKARQEAALQALHDENKRLGLYDYEIGFIEGKAQRTWVGLTDEEIAQGNKESFVTQQAFESAVYWAEAKLKEKNT